MNTSEKTDRRIVRTKLLLRKALLELMKEKGMERVTVKDLTERADINRGTFYLHYRDPYDLLDQFKAEILKGLAEVLVTLNPYEMKAYAGKGEPYPNSMRVFEYLEKRADFFEIVFSPQGDLGVSLQIRDFIKKQLHTHVFLKVTKEKELAVPHDFLFAYISSAMLGLIMHWFETGRKLSPAEMASLTTRIMADGPLASIR